MAAINLVLFFALLCSGTVNWLDNLNWEGRERWHNVTQEAFEINMINEGYVKKVDNLVFYTILRAGHSVSTATRFRPNLKYLIGRALLLRHL